MISWNIWGAQSARAKRHMMDLIGKYNPTFLIIIETHVAFDKNLAFWTKDGYVKLQVVEAEGHSGGIWILKQSGSSIQVDLVDIYSNTITLKLSCGNLFWYLTGIYASPTYVARVPLWDYLYFLSQHLVGSWLMLGEIIEITTPSEQRGEVFNQNKANGLLKVMDRCNMLDIHSNGGKFTWHRNCRGQRRNVKKLDRGMANLTWRCSFPSAFMEVFSRLHSDHNPLLIRCGGLLFRQGNRPFRFEAAWITHPDYHQVVQSTWTSALSNLVVGLKRVEEDSIIFTKEIFGSIKKRKYCIERRLKGIHKALENIDYASLVYLEHQLQKDYNTILFQEELLWYQKSRDNWIKLGDHKTRFFHPQTVVRRNHNKIHGLNLPDGLWCIDDDILKVEAIKYFKDLFCSSTTHVLPPVGYTC